MVHTTHWLISDLVQSGTFTLGIQALAKADAIVIAVHGADRFPGAFYMWVNLWLQVRSRKPGALVALVGTSNKRSSEFMETRRYLHAVASQGHLDLFFSECDPSEGSVGIPEQELLHWAQAA